MTPEQIKMLEAPLDPRNVKPPPQGKYGEYVDAHHVITEANRIFGHGGWSYVITSLELCAKAEAEDRNGNPQVRVAYRCTVRATVEDATREGAAVGTGMAKPENEGDAHESAVKEAETDALKRALRSFGNTFGLALYDKTKADVSAPEPQKISDQQIELLIEHLEALNIPAISLIEVANQHLDSKITKITDLPAGAFDNALSWVRSQRKAV